MFVRHALLAHFLTETLATSAKPARKVKSPLKAHLLADSAPQARPPISIMPPANRAPQVPSRPTRTQLVASPAPPARSLHPVPTTADFAQPVAKLLSTRPDAMLAQPVKCLNTENLAALAKTAGRSTLATAACSAQVVSLALEVLTVPTAPLERTPMLEHLRVSLALLVSHRTTTKTVATWIQR